MDCAQICAQVAGPLPVFLRAICGAITAQHGKPNKTELDLTPGQLDYLRRLIKAILEGRAVVACYNIVVVSVILFFTFLHFRQAKRDKRKWDEIKAKPIYNVSQPSALSGDGASSSTEATASPLGDDDKDLDVDLESLPLLLSSPSTSVNHKSTPEDRHYSAASISKSFLAYEPPTLFDKTLPCNGKSLFILGWFAIVLFFHFYRLPLSWDYFFVFADRAGCHFIVNLPLLYLLGAKNQPLRAMTGYSYEQLNFFHRRIGEMMCFEALVHFSAMVYYQFCLAEDWLLVSHSAKEYFTHPIILMGLGALTSYQLLYFTSLRSFRQRWYELFLASHIVLQVLALVFLAFHYPTSRWYVCIAMSIFIADRIVWRSIYSKKAKVIADLTVLDPETLLVSADWDLPFREKNPGFTGGYWSVLHTGWEPAAHVFLSVPELGKTHSLQAHPFTIASAAPGRVKSNHDEWKHTWLCLLVRAQNGFTAELLQLARTKKQVSVQLDGPYGSQDAVNMLRASRFPVLVAGGSGIAVVFSMVWSLLNEEEFRTDEGGNVVAPRRRKRKISLLWVTRSRNQQEWVPSKDLDLLVERGLELVMPPPTEEVGRPNVRSIVMKWVEEAGLLGEDASVVVSGPDELNRAVRNACADSIAEGHRPRIAVEKFGW
ncbi:hypothetical protein QBC38DRAFT_223166 [Podospora fimiseda]|uniref:FAD-binding FR-type domain-containing protein n=1 Tax=Podospora fimiseda TaxID=252190 RepID=A0AAN7BXM6_9PEZI|nr:hypothetical protein QBC38DRAFT_223166 [Podospora fimiseda]